MLDFAYYNPTRIIFGKSSMEQLGSQLKGQGASKVLLVYGGESIKKNGVYRKVVDVLEAESLEFYELSGVKPNPRVSLVRDGVALGREKGIDFILAVGGGSVIDTAKAVAAGIVYDGDIWEPFAKMIRFSKAVPLGVVLTIPAAGSETSSGTVISNEEEGLKRYTGGECLIPKFAVMNPEFTLSLPAYQTACGISDIIAHMMERYFTNIKHVDLTDRMIEGAIKTVMLNAAEVMADSNNYEARAEIMWAGTIAHGGLLNTGRLMGDWGSHDISHELSARYDLAHGAALSIIFPAWMKYVYKVNPDKFIQFAQRVFNMDLSFDDKDVFINRMIEKLEGFYRSIGMPVTLSEANINGEFLEDMAEKAVLNRGTVGNLKKLDAGDILKIYQLAV